MQIENLLKQHALRVTPVRIQVLAYFHRISQAVSHGDLELEFPSLDRITLYRTLKSFEENGILHSFKDIEGQSRYALCEHECVEHTHHDEHLHFHCTLCKQYFCLNQVAMSPMQLPVGFQIKQIHFSAEGLCANCAKS